MSASDEQALLAALNAEYPPPAGWHWRLTPHPEPGWFWASKAHPTEPPTPGGVLLCGPNGRRLTMSSIPGMRGDSPAAVSVLRELGASDLSDSELKVEIYSREEKRRQNPLLPAADTQLTHPTNRAPMSPHMGNTPTRVTSSPSKEPLTATDQNLLNTYFQAGHILVAARRLNTDPITGQPNRVPVGYATDGIHIWSLETAYNTRVHAITPEPASFLDIVRARKGTCPTVTEEVAEAIRADLLQSDSETES